MSAKKKAPKYEWRELHGYEGDFVCEWHDGLVDSCNEAAEWENKNGWQNNQMGYACSTHKDSGWVAEGEPTI